MKIVEICPKCGADIEDLMIATYPPIPAKRCTKCDWRWEGEREEVVRVPFKEPNKKEEINTEPNYILNVPYELEDYSIWVLECCRNCANHPSNGGSGICCCMLPYMTRSTTTPTRSKTFTTTRVVVDKNNDTYTTASSGVHADG